MTTDLKVFHEQDVLGKLFKIYGDKDNPLFLAKDVANWIEHNKPSEMIKNVDKDEKIKVFVDPSDTATRVLQANTEYWFLTKKGVKQVLSNSRKLKAKELSIKIEDGFVYKTIPKQTKFEFMLNKAIDIHIKESDVDWKFCPFNSEEDYFLTYDDAVYYKTEFIVGKYRLDFYFPKFNLVVEYDEKHHKYNKEYDSKRENELIGVLGENTKIIRVKEGEEFEGVIKIITYLCHYAFVY